MSLPPQPIFQFLNWSGYDANRWAEWLHSLPPEEARRKAGNFHPL